MARSLSTLPSIPTVGHQPSTTLIATSLCGSPVSLSSIWSSSTTWNVDWVLLQEHQYHAEQWLYFQATGQGPYYGQSVWFKKLHSEQVPSAIERYTKKVSRVRGVLDGYLAQQKQEHGGNPGNEDHGPVGNKFSYADIAFIPWQRIVGMVLEKDGYKEDNFPYVQERLGKMTSRATVKTVLESAQPLK